MVPRTFLFIFYAGLSKLGSNNFRDSSYKEKQPVRSVFSVSYDYSFTHFSTRIAAWLLLTFLICLHKLIKFYVLYYHVLKSKDV